MKHFLLTVGCIAILSACSGGSGSFGTGSLGSAGSGNSAKSTGSASSNGSSSFGNKRTEQAQKGPSIPVDPRGFVPVLKSVKLEPTKGGHIVRVNGEMERIGYHNLELVLIDDPTSDTITYEARAAKPDIGRPVLTQRSRQVVLGAYLADRYRPNIRTIRIQGLQSTLTIRR